MGLVVQCQYLIVIVNDRFSNFEYLLQNGLFFEKLTSKSFVNFFIWIDVGVLEEDGLAWTVLDNTVCAI
jgi:hypothetical protein